MVVNRVICNHRLSILEPGAKRLMYLLSIVFLYFPLQMTTKGPSVNLNNKVFEGKKTVVVADKASHLRVTLTS